MGSPRASGERASIRSSLLHKGKLDSWLRLFEQGLTAPDAGSVPDVLGANPTQVIAGAYTLSVPSRQLVTVAERYGGYAAAGPDKILTMPEVTQLMKGNTVTAPEREK